MKQIYSKKSNLNKRSSKKQIHKTLFSSNAYQYDSMDELLGIEVLAQSSCSGSTTCSCLLPNTPILLPDLSTKPISELKINDLVLSYNVDKQSPFQATILKVFHHDQISDGYLLINNSLKITTNHPIYVQNKKQFLPAGQLAINDSLLDTKGNPVLIDTIEHINSQTDVYNLEVSGEAHTYFASGFLVHNKEAAP